MRAMLTLCALLTVAWTRDRIVLLVENRSSSERAAAELTPAVTEVLASKGYEVVPRGEVAAALATVGAGAQGALPAGAAEKLRTALRAESILTVTIRFVLDAEARARGPRANPAFGVSAVLVGEGEKTTWRNSLGWIADDAPAPGALGFKRGPPKPTALACERLLWSLPRGRKDPSAVPAAAVAIADQPKPPTSTRFSAPVRRLRDSAGVARFPLKMIR
ncbi:MAG: hypothetical protein ACXWLM_05010 [Myxococcales bacterium]